MFERFRQSLRASKEAMEAEEARVAEERRHEQEEALDNGTNELLELSVQELGRLAAREVVRGEGQWKMSLQTRDYTKAVALSNLALLKHTTETMVEPEA